MAHPWSKPLDSLQVMRSDLETELMGLGHLLEPIDGLFDPCLDPFFLDVHVDVEGPARGLERQQTRLPNLLA